MILIFDLSSSLTSICCAEMWRSHGTPQVNASLGETECPLYHDASSAKQVDLMLNRETGRYHIQADEAKLARLQRCEFLEFASFRDCWLRFLRNSSVQTSLYITDIVFRCCSIVTYAMSSSAGIRVGRFCNYNFLLCTSVVRIFALALPSTASSRGERESDR